MRRTPWLLKRKHGVCALLDPLTSLGGTGAATSGSARGGGSHFVGKAPALSKRNLSAPPGAAKGARGDRQQGGEASKSLQKRSQGPWKILAATSE